MPKPTQFFDKMELGGVNRTKDGYLTSMVKVSRTGIQLYPGAAVGMPDKEVVRVYRPEGEVFNKDSMKSYAYRPVTLDHPTEDVTAENWRDHGKGITGGDVIRDGDFVRVPLILMDAATISAVAAGKREVSMGYSAIVEFKDGVTEGGEPYDAIQRELRMNHLAIVSKARGGSDLRIGDEEGDPPMAERTVLLDGISVVTTEQGAQAIEKLQRDIKTLRDSNTAELATRDGTITQLKADISKKDGEMAVMKKQIDDGVMTPAKLDAAVISRAALIADAKKIAGDTLVTTGKTDSEIRRAAVATKLGDEAAKALDDAAIAGAFAYAAKDAGGSSQQNGNGNLQPLRNALSDSKQQQDASAAADKSWSDYVTDLTDGYKTKQPEKAAALG